MAGKHRSPKFPFINLEKALDRARELYSKEGMHPTSIAVVVDHWGYNYKSSGGLQTISALVSYGLLEDEGRGPSRKVNISERARRILLDPRPNSEERNNLIAECALSPPIFSEIWDRWRDKGRMSDENMVHFLVFDKNFNEHSVDDFIRVFKDTVEYAKLENSTNIEVEEENERRYEEESERDIERQPLSKLKRQRQKGMNEDIFTLDEGQVVLQWPAQFSQESYEDFESWLDLIKRKAKRAITKDDPEQLNDDRSE